MKGKFGVAILLSVLTAGCATMSGGRILDWTDGIDRNEAKEIARRFIGTTQFTDDVDLKTVKVVEKKNAACLSAHWLVTLADRSVFWQSRYYYVIIDKASGKVVRSGVNWAEGDHTSPMLRGIDQCK